MVKGLDMMNLQLRSLFLAWRSIDLFETKAVFDQLFQPFAKRVGWNRLLGVVVRFTSWCLSKLVVDNAHGLG